MFINDIDFVQINNSMYILPSDIITLNDYDNCKLMVDIKNQGQLVKTFDITNSSEIEGSDELSLLTDFSIDCYYEDLDGQIVSDKYTLDNMNIDSMNLAISISNNNLNATSTVSNKDDFKVKYNTFDDALISNKDLIFDYSTTLSSSTTDILDNTVKSMTYEIYYKNKLLYKSESLDCLNATIESKDLTKDGIVIKTDLKDITSGYLMDNDNNKIDLVIDGDTITIPSFFKYKRVNYSEYKLYLLNDYAMNTLDVATDDMIIIDNLVYENSYSANNLLKFNAYIASIKDYLLVLEVYENNTLVESNTYAKENIRNEIYYYLQSISKQLDFTVKIHFEDTDGNILGEIKETIITADAFADVQFNLSMPNPGDVLLTHNADDTINLYFPMNYDTTETNIKLRIVLYDDDDELIYDFDAGTMIAKIENILNKSYGITYIVYKQYDSFVRYYEDTSPSGAVNENNELILNGETITEDGNTYLTIDVSNYALTYEDDELVDNISFDEDKCSVIGNDNWVYDSTTHTFKILITDETSVEFVIYYGNSNCNNNLTNLLEIDSSFEYQGELGYYQTVIVYIN